MTENDFVAYRGPRDLHDGTVLSVARTGDATSVVVGLSEGDVAEFDFRDTEELVATEPKGMVLYALAELRADGPSRRFSFVNWEDSSSRVLEVRARGGRWRTQSSGVWRDL